MFVTKRDGSEEPMSFDKITNRLKKLMWELDNKNINLSPGVNVFKKETIKLKHEYTNK